MITNSCEQTKLNRKLSRINISMLENGCVCVCGLELMKKQNNKLQLLQYFSRPTSKALIINITHIYLTL